MTEGGGGGGTTKKIEEKLDEDTQENNQSQIDNDMYETFIDRRDQDTLEEPIKNVKEEIFNTPSPLDIKVEQL